MFGFEGRVLLANGKKAVPRHAAYDTLTALTAHLDYCRPRLPIMRELMEVRRNMAFSNRAPFMSGPAWQSRALYWHNTAVQFKHRPLDRGPRSIRLISVLRDLSENGSIRCHMRHTTTDDDYQCLSYRWGPMQPMRSIVVCDWCSGEEKPFLVSQNLHDFLLIAQQRKTYSQRDDTSVNLELEIWIDALCIDQTNPDEKNHQVGLMGTIYSKAYNTIIWLGARTSDNQNWRQLYREGPSHLWENAVSKNEYWSRAWITQEVILARTITVLMGDFARPFLDVACENNLDLRFWKDAIKGSESRASLLQLLSAKRAQRCSIPRDRIYSLLSLVREGADIEIDYVMSHANLAFSVLRACGSEFCLCHIRLMTEVLPIATHTKACYEEGPFIKMQLKVDTSSGDPELPECSKVQLDLSGIRALWRSLMGAKFLDRLTISERKEMEKKTRGLSVREGSHDGLRLCIVHMPLWAFAIRNSIQSNRHQDGLPESLCHVSREGATKWIQVHTGWWAFWLPHTGIES